MLKSGAYDKRLTHFDTIVKNFENNLKISEVLSLSLTLDRSIKLKS